jgi:hypothetical protein
MVYGAICYLLARFFVLLGLKAARVFVGAGMGLTYRPGAGAAGASKIDVLWPAPTWADLQPARPPFGAEGWDPLAGWLVGIWLAIVIALLCAFVSSFFLSGSTAIYYLLRREVDATDFEEVFFEDEEDEDRGFDVPEAAGEIGALSSSGGGERMGPGTESSSRPPVDQMDQSNPPAAGDGDIDAE